jgi:subtilase family serine protease
VVFSGTAGRIEDAFQTELHNYEYAGRLHVAPAGPIKIPDEFLGLADTIRGLEDFALQRYRRVTHFRFSKVTQGA